MSTSFKSGRAIASIAVVLGLVAPATVASAASTSTQLDNQSFNSTDGGCTSLSTIFQSSPSGGTPTGNMTPSSTQTSSGVTVSGIVTSGSAPLPGAMLISFSEQGTPLGCKMTDQSGAYANLPVSGKTQIIVAGPSGPQSLTYASSTRSLTVESSQPPSAQNFQLSTVDLSAQSPQMLAVPFFFAKSFSKEDKMSAVRLNSQLVIACLEDAKNGTLYTCGIARDRSNTVSHYYDARLDLTTVPQDRRDYVGIHAFGAVIMPDGTKQDVERRFLLCSTEADANRYPTLTGLFANPANLTLVPTSPARTLEEDAENWAGLIVAPTGNDECNSGSGTGSGSGSGSPILENPDNGCSSVNNFIENPQSSDGQPLAIGSVSGNVANGAGPVENAMLVAIDMGHDGKFLGCVETDSSGNYTDLPAAAYTRILVSPPSGSAGADMASADRWLELSTGENLTDVDFELSAPDLAIPFYFMADPQGDWNTAVRVNTHIIFGCLADVEDNNALYGCALARNRTDDQSNYYDIRLSSDVVPEGRRDFVKFFVMGQLPTSSGQLMSIGREVTFDNRPDGMSRFDMLKSYFGSDANLSRVPTAPATSLEEDESYVGLMLFPQNGGGDNGGGGGNKFSSTNCSQDQSPFLTGTVTTPGGDPAANYAVELRAFWTSSTPTYMSSMSSGWVAGWSPDASRNIQIATDDNGQFSLCRNQGSISPYYNFSQQWLYTPEWADGAKLWARVSPMMSNGDHSVASTTILTVGDENSNYKDCVSQSSTSCAVELRAMEPQVTGWVQTTDGDPISGAFVSVFQGLGSSSYHYFDSNPSFSIPAGGDGWFGFATNFPADSFFKVTAGPPYCDASSQGSCQFADLVPVSIEFRTGESGDAEWIDGFNVGIGTSQTFELAKGNFFGTLTREDGTPIETRLAVTPEWDPENPVEDPSQTCDYAFANSNYWDGSFALNLVDCTYSVELWNLQNVDRESRFTVTVSGGSVTQVKRTAAGTTITLCGEGAEPCSGAINLKTAPANFRGMFRSANGDVIQGGIRLERQCPEDDYECYPWRYSETYNENGDFGFVLADGTYTARLWYGQYNSGQELTSADRNSVFTFVMEGGKVVQVSRTSPDVLDVCGIGSADPCLSVVTLQTAASNFAGVLKSWDNKAIATNLYINCVEQTEGCESQSIYSSWQDGTFAAALGDGTYTISLSWGSYVSNNPDSWQQISDADRQTEFTMVVSGGVVSSVVRSKPDGAAICGGMADACSGLINLQTAQPNFAGVFQSFSGSVLKGITVALTCGDGDEYSNGGTSGGGVPTNGGNYGDSSCNQYLYTNWEDGTFTANLSDGTYSASLYGSSFDLSDADRQTKFSIVVAGGAVDSISVTAPTASVVCDNDSNTPASVCVAPFTLQTATPNFTVIVKSDEGSPVEGARLQLNKYVGIDPYCPYCGDGWDYSSEGFKFAETEFGESQNYWQKAGIAGRAALTLEANTIYKLRLDPPYFGESGVSPVELIIKTGSLVDGSLPVYRCAKLGQPTNGQMPIPCDQELTSSDLLGTVTPESSTYLLVMPSANFKASVCRPGDSGCTFVSNVSVQISKAETYQDYGNGSQWTNWYYYNNVWLGESGKFTLSFEEDGAYKFTLYQPYNWYTGEYDSELVQTEIRVYVDVADDGSAQITLADNNGESIPGTQLDVVNGRYVLRYTTPNVRGTLIDPTGGDGAANAWIEVQSVYSNEYCTRCTSYLTSVSTGRTGEFALNLPDGDYVLRANPSWQADGLSVKVLPIRVQDCVGSDGVGEIYSGDAPGCESSPVAIPLVDGRLQISLTESMFVGVLYNPRNDPKTVIPWSGYHYEKWNGQFWEWQPSWGNTNQSGHFGINFEQTGKYRVTFDVPYYLSSELSSSRVVVNVTEQNGELVATPVLEESGGVITASDIPGNWDVSLSLPNVSGHIKSSDGLRDITNAWINVQKWYSGESASYMCGPYNEEGCWGWSPEISGTNSDWNTGSFAMTLSQGNWRLQVNPPYYELDSTMTTVDVLVDSAGKVCIASNKVSICGDGDAINPGEFDIQLGKPNLSGYVVTESLAGDTPSQTELDNDVVSRWSALRFEKWDAAWQYWSWAPMWGQTNWSGYFAQNITEPGVYRIVFDPSWQLPDYSATTKYLAVCADGGAIKVKYLATEDDAKTWNCAAPGSVESMSTSVSDQVLLRGANVVGLVVKPGSSDPVPLGDVWVSVSTCEQNPWYGEWCYWVKGASTKRGDWDRGTPGSFTFRIDNATDTPVKYRFEFNPPWNDLTGLVRQQIDVYFAKFGASGDETRYCLKDDYNSGDQTCGDGNSKAKSYTDTWTVTLTSGNMAGKVVTPDAKCANTDLSSECVGMANAWMQVEKWSAMPWDASAYGWMWQPVWANSTGEWTLDPESGEWLLENASSGNFGLNITTSGLYRITVNPGWNNPNAYSRTSYVVSVAEDGNWCVNTGVSANSLPNVASPIGVPCTPTSTDNVDDQVTGFTARLSGSNFSGVLYDSTASLPSDSNVSARKVGNSWMSLQKEFSWEYCWNNWEYSEEDGWQLKPTCYTYKYWQWVSGANTAGAGNGKGKFGLTITEPGNYRLEVYPAWDNANASTQFHIDFTVDPSGTCVQGNTDPTNCELPTTIGGSTVDSGLYRLQYPKPNFAGTLYDKDGPKNGAGATVGGAWISVYEFNTWRWAGGMSTTWNGPDKGDFAMLIDEPGTYRVEIYPPWDQQDSGMRRVYRAVVSEVGGQMKVTKILLGESSDTALCDDDGGTACGSSFDLSLLGASVKGHVYYPGASDTVGDAYAAATANDGGFQTVMPWAGAQVLKCTGTWTDEDMGCYQWTTWSNSDYDGTLRFGLEDGVYRVQIWPNYGLYQSGILEVDVEVSGNQLLHWRYTGDELDSPSAAFTPDFGRRKPNVKATVAGITTSRFVQVSTCAAGSTPDSGGTPGTCLSPTEFARLSTTFATSWGVALYLEPNTIYKIAAVREESDSSTPCNSVDVVQVEPENTESNQLVVPLDLATCGP